MTNATTVPVLVAAASGHAGHGQLIAATMASIAVVILLITWARFTPFLALMLGSATLAVGATVPPQDAVKSFTKGVGDTFGSVGILVALGAVVGRLLVDSGGAGRVVDSIVGRVPAKVLPWALAGAAALIGLPMFFEIGVVLLVPIVIMVANRSRLPVLLLGIPALAGLSVLHGMVPPHPGPLVAIDALKADLGLTLGLGILVAVPTVIIAGPVLARFVAPWGPQEPPPALSSTGDVSDVDRPPAGRTPTVGATLAVVLLPVVLMLGKAFADLVLSEGSGLYSALDLLGTPVIALLLGALAAMVVLGYRTGVGREGVGSMVDRALPPIAGALLVIAAGGGFKQTLVDSGVGDLVAQYAKGAHLNVLVLGWLVAVGIRLATGSATVSTITAAGIVGPLTTGLSPAHVALTVIAVGSGSLFFSHVNDVGFWMVKQYFGMTVKQTLLSWSVMESVIAVCGLAFSLLLWVVV